VPTFTISTASSPFGMIGIGITNPTSTLAVLGSVHFQTSGGASGFFYDQSNNRAGLGTTTPRGLLGLNDPIGIDSFIVGSSTPKFIVKDSGFIGLGTSTPSYKLTVNSESATENFFQVASSTQQGIFVITNDGRVGIGTTSPSQKLSVAGTIYASGGVRFGDGFTQVSAVYSSAAKTADYTITASDNGKTFNNNGATALVTFTLPTADASQKYNFKIVDSDGIRIAASGSDTIFIGGTTLSAPAFATSTVVGSEFIVESYAANKWTARLVGVQPSFRAYMSASQTSFTVNTDTLINFDTEHDDNMGEYDNSASNYKYSPTIPGKYKVGILTQGNVKPTETAYYIKIFKNGAEHKHQFAHNADGSYYIVVPFNVSDEIIMDDNDTIQPYIKVGISTGSIEVINSFSTLFYASRIPD
ncbi:MAG: hypothetical protein AAB474_02955, partial [Patescibacteria group bacterium]